MSIKNYEKPLILKAQTRMSNKFGASPSYARKTRGSIDGVSIDRLVSEYGSPLFVFSESTLRRRFREISNAFSTRYPNVTFGWSYKTNYLDAVCAVLHQEGAMAEVVSGMEYRKASELGIPGKNIIFNGPHKSPEFLRQAVTDGAMINIDHFEELYDLESLADQLGAPLRVGLRINMDTGIQPQWSRFGLNLESGEALEAVKRMADNRKLIPRGLHCHQGTYILEPDAYSRQVEKMARFAYQVQEHCGFKIDYLDIGGGFPSRHKLKGTYHSPDLAVPGIDEYAEAITSSLYRNLRPGDFPRLILECGRAIVDEAGYLITSILASKRLHEGRRAYIADAGINLLYTSFWYEFNLELDREVRGMGEPSVIYGPLCMNIDVLHEGTILPPLEKGTRLILSPVGAYNVSQWMQFIQYRPNVVMVGEDQGVDIIREAEDLSDIRKRERLPQRLKPASSIIPHPRTSLQPGVHQRGRDDFAAPRAHAVGMSA
jgi:diaminopimelate decarboxylase